MTVKLIRYNSWDGYNRNIADEKWHKPTMTEAIEEAKQDIREHKRTINFVGYKIFDKSGQLRHKLHNQ